MSATKHIKDHQKFIASLKLLLSSYRFLLKPSFVFSTIYFVGLLAVIRANFSYIDDAGRILNGMQGWGADFSRYLSDFLSTFVNTSSSLTDISPLTTMIATLLMGLATAIAIHVITGTKKFGFWHYVVGVPIGLSPYFLECYSYKFDAPYMALSVLASVVPFLFYSKKKISPFCLAVFASSLVVCMTYQASSGIFLVLLLLLSLRDLLETDTRRQVIGIFKRLAVPAAVFLAGVLFYRLFLMKPYDGYVSNSLPPLLDIPIVFLRNLKHYYALVFQDFNPLWLILMGIIALLFVALSVIKSKRNKIVSLIMVGGALLAVAAGCFGAYPLLEDPLTAPRAMFGLTVSFGFICIFAFRLVSGNGRLLVQVPVFMIAWCYLVFAFTYGNTLSEQQKYATFRMEETFYVLSSNNIITEETQNITIDGELAHAPATWNAITQFPLLSRMVPKVYSGSDRFWDQHRFFYYYGVPSELYDRNYVAPADSDLDTIETYFEAIKYNNQYIHVELKSV